MIQKKKKSLPLAGAFVAVLLLTVISCAHTEEENLRPTLVIGDHEWMIRNLNVATFNNGDTIPEARTEAEWIRAWQEETPAWCYYNNAGCTIFLR